MPIRSQAEKIILHIEDENSPLGYAAAAEGAVKFWHDHGGLKDGLVTVLKFANGEMFQVACKKTCITVWKI